MSGLAKICLHNGAAVSGSDVNNNSHIDNLRLLGAKIFNNHDKDNISKNIDLVVLSGAISKDNVELLYAKELGIKVVERSQFIGYISKCYKSVIAISGTHGKTTTSSLIGYIFYCAKLNPTIHIGGDMVNFNNNTIIGGSDYLIIEACEYRESFKFLNPETSIITNIECDHLDYYKDYNHICSAFTNFANNSKYLIKDVSVKINHEKYEEVGSDWTACNIEYKLSGYDYDVYFKNKFIGHFRLNMIGEYNVINSIFAISVAYKYRIDIETIIKAVASFKGVKRRNELIGNIDNIPIVCDYAHHPTEINNSIKGIRQIFNNPLIIFQPHTYSRTLTLFKDFVKVFNDVDNVIMYKTYPARETLIEGGTAKDLYNAITCNNKYYIEDVCDLVKSIKKIIKNNKIDGVIVLGAGNLYDMLENYVNKLKKVLTCGN